MKSRSRIAWPRTFKETMPELAMFAVAIALAWWREWRTTDLLWSTWLAGIVVGYAAVIIGVIGDAVHGWGNRTVMILTLGIAVFYSVHFLGFNWIVATWLPIIAPLDGLRGGVWSGKFWSVLFTYYWPMVLMAAVAQREMLRGAWHRFDRVGPYLPVVRTWVVYLPLFFIVLLGDMTKLYTVDHFVCYVIAAVAYFSPWRLAPDAENPLSSIK